MTGAIQTTVAKLRTTMDRRTVFRPAIVLAGMLGEREPRAAWFVAVGLQEGWNRCGHRGAFRDRPKTSPDGATGNEWPRWAQLSHVLLNGWRRWTIDTSHGIPHPAPGRPYADRHRGHMEQGSLRGTPGSTWPHCRLAFATLALTLAICQRGRQTMQLVAF